MLVAEPRMEAGALGRADQARPVGRDGQGGPGGEEADEQVRRVPGCDPEEHRETGCEQVGGILGRARQRNQQVLAGVAPGEG